MNKALGEQVSKAECQPDQAITTMDRLLCGEHVKSAGRRPRRAGSAIKIICCLFGEPKLSSQCLYGGSQPSLAPGDLMSSSDPVNTRHACGNIHACRQSTHTHKNKTNKLLSTGGEEDGC